MLSFFLILVFDFSLAMDALRFISTRQRKGEDSIPKTGALAVVYPVITVLGYVARMKVGFNALQHELKQTHGNRIGS